jgi:hypothetical protein
MHFEEHSAQRWENFQLPVCRFLVQSVSCTKGRSKRDFYVDLVLAVDGLLTLIKSVYGILKKSQRMDETYRSLHWRLHFQGEVFTLADPEVHHFRFTNVCKGQTGWFEGSKVSFRFTVLDTHSSEICSNRVGSYPRIEVAPHHIIGESTSVVDQFWISDEEKMKSLESCDDSQDSMNDTGPTVLCKAHRCTAEDLVTTDLTHPHVSFKDSCKVILQYAAINGTKPVTAIPWEKHSSEEQFLNMMRLDPLKARGTLAQEERKAFAHGLLEGHSYEGYRRRMRPVEEGNNYQMHTEIGPLGLMPKRRRLVSFTTMTPPPVVTIVGSFVDGEHATDANS